MQKIVILNNFLVKTKFDQKKLFWSKIILGQNFFGSNKIFGAKNMLGQKNLGQKLFWVPENFWAQKLASSRGGRGVGPNFWIQFIDLYEA